MNKRLPGNDDLPDDALARELRQLELATSHILPDNAALDAETQLLREGFLAFGFALTQAESQLPAAETILLPKTDAGDARPRDAREDRSDAAASEATWVATKRYGVGSKGWLALGTVAALCILGAIVFSVVVREGNVEDRVGALAPSVAKSDQDVPASNPEGAAHVTKSAAAQADDAQADDAQGTLAWDDSFDDALAQVGQRIRNVRASASGFGTNASGVGERLDEFVQELEAERL